MLLDAGGVALGGYDPVAYFRAGRATAGDAAWSASHGEATYFFVDSAHRDAFLQEPERYLPAYGGYCAWALAAESGALVSVDPRSFLIQDGRLLLFYDGVFADTRAMWLEQDVNSLAASADANWSRILSERSEP